MKERDIMHLEKKTDKRRHYSSYALTKLEEEIFFEWLSSIKVSFGFSLNINGIINMAKKKSRI
jgi:hypothetical protein